MSTKKNFSLITSLAVGAVLLFAAGVQAAKVEFTFKHFDNLIYGVNVDSTHKTDKPVLEIKLSARAIAGDSAVFWRTKDSALQSVRIDSLLAVLGVDSVSGTKGASGITTVLKGLKVRNATVDSIDVKDVGYAPTGLSITFTGIPDSVSPAGSANPWKFWQAAAPEGGIGLINWTDSLEGKTGGKVAVGFKGTSSDNIVTVARKRLSILSVNYTRDYNGRTTAVFDSVWAKDSTVVVDASGTRVRAKFGDTTSTNANYITIEGFVAKDLAGHGTAADAPFYIDDDPVAADSTLIGTLSSKDAGTATITFDGAVIKGKNAYKYDLNKTVPNTGNNIIINKRPLLITAVHHSRPYDTTGTQALFNISGTGSYATQYDSAGTKSDSALAVFSADGRVGIYAKNFEPLDGTVGGEIPIESFAITGLRGNYLSDSVTVKNAVGIPDSIRFTTLTPQNGAISGVAITGNIGKNYVLRLADDYTGVDAQGRGFYVRNLGQGITRKPLTVIGVSHSMIYKADSTFAFLGSGTSTNENKPDSIWRYGLGDELQVFYKDGAWVKLKGFIDKVPTIDPLTTTNFELDSLHASYNSRNVGKGTIAFFKVPDSKTIGGKFGKNYTVATEGVWVANGGGGITPKDMKLERVVYTKLYNGNTAVAFQSLDAIPSVKAGGPFEDSLVFSVVGDNGAVDSLVFSGGVDNDLGKDFVVSDFRFGAGAVIGTHNPTYVGRGDVRFTRFNLTGTKGPNYKVVWDSTGYTGAATVIPRIISVKSLDNGRVYDGTATLAAARFESARSADYSFGAGEVTIKTQADSTGALSTITLTDVLPVDVTALTGAPNRNAAFNLRLHGGDSTRYVSDSARTTKVRIAGTLSGLLGQNYRFADGDSITTAAPGIQPKAITVASTSSFVKDFDNTTAIATLVGGTATSAGNTLTVTSGTNKVDLTGFLTADLTNVSLSAFTGTYDNKNAGVDKSVTVSAATIGGTKGRNYTFATATVPNVGEIKRVAINADRDILFTPQAQAYTFNWSGQGVGSATTGATAFPVPTVTNPVFATEGGNTWTITYRYREVGETTWRAAMPVNVGKYEVEATLSNGGYTGTKTSTFAIAPKTLTAGTTTSNLRWATTAAPTFEYNGTARTPTEYLTDDVVSSVRRTLVAGTDFIGVTGPTNYWENNVNASRTGATALVSIQGIGNFTGTASIPFNINPKVVAVNAAATSGAFTKVYDGKRTFDTTGVKVAFTGLIASDEAGFTNLGANGYFVTDSSAFKKKDVGKDTVTLVVGLPATGNYRFAGTGTSWVFSNSVKFVGEITKKSPAASDFVSAIVDGKDTLGHLFTGVRRGVGPVAFKTDGDGSTGLTVLYSYSSTSTLGGFTGDTTIAPTAAGTYAVKVRVKGAPNYADSIGGVPLGDYTIAPARRPVVEAAAFEDTTVRQEDTLILTVTASTPSEDEDQALLSYQWFANGAAIAGATSKTYRVPTANMTPEGEPNKYFAVVKYTPDAAVQVATTDTSDVVSVTVIKGAVSLFGTRITLEETDYVYDGLEKTPRVVSATLTGETLQENTDYRVSYRANTNAGDGIVVLTGINAFKGTAERSFVIAKKDVELEDLLVKTTTTYNRKVQPLEVTVAPPYTGLGDVVVTYRVGSDSGAVVGVPENAGRYFISATVTEGENFFATPADTTFNLGTYVINKKSLGVDDFTVPAIENKVFNGSRQGIGTVTFLGKNDSLPVLLYNDTLGAPSEIGTHVVTMSIKGAVNYLTSAVEIGRYRIISVAEVVTDAVTAISRATYGPVLQADVNTADAAKATVESVIDGLTLGEGVTTTVSGRFTPAVDGNTAGTPTGTAGQYRFVVRVQKDTVARTTDSLTLVITATVNVASNDRVIPGKSDESAVVAPVSVVAGEFTVGPNPVSKASGKVGFFWNGSALKSGTLYVFDGSGSLVTKVAVASKGAKEIGSWNLVDAKGRPVAEGTYLVRGALVTKAGSKVKVSSVIGVAK